MNGGKPMVTNIDEKLLDQILTDLEKARSWTPRTIAKLESLIHSEDEFALFRIDWQLLCPLCGAITRSFNSLHDVHSDYFCALCQCGAEASVDDYMEVS